MKPKDVISLRRRLGWTLAQLAAELGTTVNTVWRWEHGVQAISPPYQRLLQIVVDKSLAAA
jgi:DNA-binding transcriptional regulator YiaG